MAAKFKALGQNVYEANGRLSSKWRPSIANRAGYNFKLKQDQAMKGREELYRLSL